MIKIQNEEFGNKPTDKNVFRSWTYEAFVNGITPF